MSGKAFRHVVFLFGDQLSHSLGCFDAFDKENDVIVMMEVDEEATYVRHHIHKIILLFSAMRHFASELQDNGFQVCYMRIDDPNNQQSFDKNIKQFLTQHSVKKLILTEPGEFRIQEKINSWINILKIPVKVEVDTRFFCTRKEFSDWAANKKQLRMEFFYREMRKKTGILMQGKKPTGGKWNYDADNRKSANKTLSFPKTPTFRHDKITRGVVNIVNHRYKNHIGDPESFCFAVTNKDARKALKHFITYALDSFGTYQDAMWQGEYTLFHSQLSMYMNIGLLTPQEIIDTVLEAYKTRKIALHHIEGYVRQILGWREYMRGLYWLKMPDYKKLNYFKHKLKLPGFYWSGNTDMACMQHAIKQTIHTATSHHIQRLMVTGNYALLIGVVPDEICEWYLAVYADAFEWVELPNTLGMSQFADGGIVASKPYISSGNYINKMSNFCKNCTYNVKEKLTEDACPFNFLYWDFLIRHEQQLKQNPRLKFAYNHVEKMNGDDKKAIAAKVKSYRSSLRPVDNW